MKHLGVQSAILSVAAPGPCLVADPDEQAALARRLNEYAAHLRDEDHATFGFFASLPDLRNTSAAVAELAYALDVLGADGVALFTRYGPRATYLGHADLEPVWRELDRREATVLVQPTHPADLDRVSQYLPAPLVDYAHETTRAAVDMITARTLKKFPRVKVVLAHAGGTLPFLMGRLAAPLRKTPGVVASWMLGTSHDEAMQAFRAFYYDIALSTSPHVLRTLLDTVPRSHIVYGVIMPAPWGRQPLFGPRRPEGPDADVSLQSDFPYAPAPAYPAFLEDLEGYDLEPEERSMINFENAMALVPRLGKQVAELK